MIGRGKALAPAVRALLEREQPVATLSAGMRARALARARAVLATPALAPSRPTRTIGWAAAAGLVFLASLAGGAAAYELGFRARQAVTPTIVSLPAERPAEPRGRPEVAPVATPAARPPRSRPDAAREELRLLQEARAAVARGDFEAALVPLTEDARRFKHGRLVEEREALRVRALAGLDRRREARRAAAAFETRFPRSPLLPAVSQMSASAP